MQQQPDAIIAGINHLYQKQHDFSWQVAMDLVSGRMPNHCPEARKHLVRFLAAERGIQTLAKRRQQFHHERRMVI
jgi:hypothetical protein